MKSGLQILFSSSRRSENENEIRATGVLTDYIAFKHIYSLDTEKCPFDLSMGILQVRPIMANPIGIINPKFRIMEIGAFSYFG